MKTYTPFTYIFLLLVSLLFSMESFAVKVVVQVSNFQFSPASVNVNVGDTMRWVWVSGIHTTTSQAIPAGALLWDSPITSASTSFEYKVVVAGTYHYICKIHSLTMIATFTAAGLPPLAVSASASPSAIDPGQTSQLNAAATGGTGTYSYSWTSVPAGFVSNLKNPVVSPSVTTQYTCQVTSGAQTQSGSTTVTVNPSIITVVAPNGGENWLQGTTHTISWTDNIPGDVIIDLYLNGSFNSTIASGVPSTGSFSWAVPAGQAPSSFYKVRITSFSDESVLDSSNTSFSVTGSVPLNAQVGDVTLSGGQSACYDATMTLTVGGAGSATVLSGGSLVLAAGQNILLEPGLIVSSGGYLHGYIVPVGPFCPPAPPVNGIGNPPGPATAADGNGSRFELVPNPASQYFRIMARSDTTLRLCRVSILSDLGATIYSGSYLSGDNMQIPVGGLSPGIYFVRITDENRSETLKLIRSER